DEWHFCPICSCYISNLGVIGGDNDLVKAFALKRSRNSPGDHGFPAEQFKVLARNALAAATRTNDGNLHCTASTKVVTTYFCCSSVSAGYMGRLIADA